MNVFISCHIDTVFGPHTYLRVKKGRVHGANDNLASVLAVARLIDLPGIEIHLTEDEEFHMDGAKYVARVKSPAKDFVIVLDVTEYKRSYGKASFTVENLNGISEKHVKEALQVFPESEYRILPKGTESEAWLYRELGFACVEICIIVKGGLHNLDSETDVGKILVAATGIAAMRDYVKKKTREELTEALDVGSPGSKTEGGKE